MIQIVDHIELYVSITDLDELLDRYDKLRSLANSGSYDKGMISRFKFLRRLVEWKFLRPLVKWKLFKTFSINTYDLPLASNPIRKEIRSTLTNILKLYEINYFRTERSDESSKEAIDSIKEYLKEIPKRGPSLVERLKNNSWTIFGVAASILPIIQSSKMSGEIQIALIVIGILVMLLLVVPLFIFRITGYLLEQDWYKQWMKKLVIKEIKNRIIKELIKINDKTYAKLETKYK